MARTLICGQWKTIEELYFSQLSQGNQMMKRLQQLMPVAGVLAGVLGLMTGALAADSAPPAKPNFVVAADGSGDFKTVQEAINAAPDNSDARVVIRIKPGTYHEQIIVLKTKSKLTLLGEDAVTTILNWNRNVNDPIPAAADKFNPGVNVRADDFRGENLTMENTSGDHGQALALRVDSDRTVFENCRFLGWQDTVMVNNGRQYFKSCYIEGRVDFIYGSGTAVFENCHIHSKNGGYITAASTPQEKPYGFVFLNCKLTGDPNPWIDPATGKPNEKSRPGALAYLGRPWRPYGSVTFINTEMDDHIRPEGWHNWGKVENEATARYSEYKSKTLDGTPVDVSKRVVWAHQLTADEAAKYTIAGILGGADNWNPVATASNVTGSTPVTKAAAMSTPARGKVRIVLAGDSTVTDDAGWGLGFKHQLKSEVELINLSKGGRSSGSFVKEGRWKQTLELKPDYVLIQFGHNDQPGHGPERETDPKTTYRANMERYVDEARAAGIQPILVTSLSRRQWGKDGKIKSTLTPYVETVKQIAAERKVPLLDLHTLSIALYEKMGKDAVLEISPTKEGGYDGTHLNAKGGEIVGRLVADALRQSVPDLAPYFNAP
jgi:pectinesterase